MKSDYPVSFVKDAGLSNGLTTDSPDAIALSIARLIEENDALRRLAALLTSRLTSRVDLTPRSAAAEVDGRRDDGWHAPTGVPFHVK